MAFAVKNVVRPTHDIRSINVAIFERKKKIPTVKNKKVPKLFYIRPRLSQNILNLPFCEPK